jgi:UTP-glucose-1-phosphate uridylyltransferase
MEVVILAAGLDLDTNLLPVTEETPKEMLPILASGSELSKSWR